jgi:NAD(P)-dependent dehydrogenase (short-subunit alcohol dehydrogenase family)
VAKLLDGRAALVTGAGSGIGREIARAYAGEGARVVVSDVNEAGAGETVARIRAAGGEAVFVRADVSKPEENAALVRAAVERYGGLHAAANNAGIAGPVAPTVDYPIDGWDRVISVNLSSVFYGMRAEIAAMLEAGGGAIVNVSSILGEVGYRGSCAYVAAKHGIVGLTRAAALEYAPKKIRVNAVGPGFIRTAMLAGLAPEALERIERAHPIGRLGEPSEVAELVAWLSSDRASFVTGAYYAVDGGYLAQ